MRVTGGRYGRHILRSPKGFEVPPISDRVKQAVFNSLGERIVDARALELFGGSAAVSLEAVRRGCKAALCIELFRRRVELIRRNAETLGCNAAVFRVQIQDAFLALGQLAHAGAQFDIIFSDPPYGERNDHHRSTSLSQKLLDNESLPRVIAPDGLSILGHTRRDRLDLAGRWREVRVLTHGDKVMRLLQGT
ncbi:MAG TPA: RsmD family RNA methyltransferase [Chthoniobacterales bacterium]|nr:RsmD family RNA methyltransferase [Chthoniobacterales bacterium]